jgi:hypothetical protein
MSRRWRHYREFLMRWQWIGISIKYISEKVLCLFIFSQISWKEEETFNYFLPDPGVGSKVHLSHMTYIFFRVGELI